MVRPWSFGVGFVLGVVPLVSWLFVQANKTQCTKQPNVEIKESVAKIGIYHATLVRVIDGDTLLCDVSLWNGLTLTATLRLTNIDALELHGPKAQPEAALTAKLFLIETLGSHPLLVRNHGPEKYGRTLATIWLVPSDTEKHSEDGTELGTMKTLSWQTSINQLLVDQGYAQTLR